MKKAFLSTVGIALMAGFVYGQAVRIYTRPLVPSAEALDKLSLKLAWRKYLPTDGSPQNGVATGQVQGNFTYFQMLDGSVVVVNGDTGQTLWRVRVGLPYKVTQPLGFNYDSVFAVNGSRLYALVKATGRVRWEFDLPNVPTAPVVADSERVYVCITGRQLVVYQLPSPDEASPESAGTYLAKKMGDDKNKKKAPVVQDQSPARSALKERASIQSNVTTPLSASGSVVRYSPNTSATKASRHLAAGYQLNERWLYSPGARLDFAPVVSMRQEASPGYLLLASANGAIFGSSKLRRSMQYDLQMDAPASAPLAQYGELVYLANRDASLSAMNIKNGQTLWRSAIGGLVTQQPVVTDDDIYVVPERAGLHRLSRATGDSLWQNPRAVKLLSANRKLVYALDARGQLLLLDRERGTLLATFDIHEFTVPIVNDFTDRIFLAAHDGLLLCLYDRDYGAPLANKQLIEEKPPPDRWLGIRLDFAKIERAAPDPGRPDDVVETVPVEYPYPWGAAAGLKVGDRVVTEVGGKPLKDKKDFDALMAAFNPGDKVPLIVFRKEGEKLAKRTITVQLPQ